MGLPVSWQGMLSWQMSSCHNNDIYRLCCLLFNVRDVRDAFSQKTRKRKEKHCENLHTWINTDNNPSHTHTHICTHGCTHTHTHTQTHTQARAPAVCLLALRRSTSICGWSVCNSLRSQCNLIGWDGVFWLAERWDSAMTSSHKSSDIITETSLHLSPRIFQTHTHTVYIHWFMCYCCLSFLFGGLFYLILVFLYFNFICHFISIFTVMFVQLVSLL